MAVVGPGLCDIGALLLELFKIFTCAALPPPRWLLAIDADQEETCEGVLTVHKEEEEDVDDSEDSAPSIESSEEVAVFQLQRIVEGSLCLIGGEHTWTPYAGQRGVGRACAKCFTVQAASPPPDADNFTTTWRIALTLDPTLPPSARVILALWREEARRCRAGGCIAGGEHLWTDASRSLVRLNVAARCCSRCGLVENNATNEQLVLPNLLGQFGAPVGTGGSAADTIPSGIDRQWLSDALARGETELRALHAACTPAATGGTEGLAAAAAARRRFWRLDEGGTDLPLTSTVGRAIFSAHTAYTLRVDPTVATRLANAAGGAPSAEGEFADFVNDVHRFELIPELAGPLNARLRQWALSKQQTARQAAEAEGVRSGGAGGVQKTNVGGYQSAPDLFIAPHESDALAELHGHFFHAMDEFTNSSRNSSRRNSSGSGSELTAAAVEATLDEDEADEDADALHTLTGWLNVNRASDHNALHVHVPERYSAIYYVDAGRATESPPSSPARGPDQRRPERGPATAAPRPDGHLIFRAGAVKLFGGGDAAESTIHYAVRPVAGTLWLFPGDIPHAVLGFSQHASPSDASREDGAPRISIAANFGDAVPPPPRRP